MERSTNTYTVQPVAFDADVQCERCGSAATHYLRSALQIAQFNDHYRVELCEACAEITVNSIDKEANWALME